MRKLTEALGSWCWGCTKDFPPPRNQLNQYSYHQPSVVQVCTTNSPIGQIVTSVSTSKENSQVTSRKTLFERHERKCQPLRKEEMIIWISGY